jgi:hypothetical protein
MISLEGDGFPSTTFWDGYSYYAQEAILHPRMPLWKGYGNQSESMEIHVA